MGLPHGRMSDRGCVEEEEWLIFWLFVGLRCFFKVIFDIIGIRYSSLSAQR